VIDTVRIADILEAPELARAVLRRTDLDGYHRHFVENALGLVESTQLDLKKPSRSGDAHDLSFSTDISGQYAKCHLLVREFNPSAADGLKWIDRHRKAAIAEVLQRWNEPPAHRLQKACCAQSKRVHDSNCNTRLISTGTVKDRMKELAPIMMDVLATAKTKRQRSMNLRSMVLLRVNGCRGCLGDLGCVYVSALKRFQIQFEEVPKEKR
jgi:hypothetical protein